MQRHARALIVSIGFPLFSRKCTLDGCSGAAGDTVPARFDAPLWPRVDRGDFGERATLRLDQYRLRRAADGEGDWCAFSIHFAPIPSLICLSNARLRWVIIVAATVMRGGDDAPDTQAPDEMPPAAPPHHRSTASTAERFAAAGGFSTGGGAAGDDPDFRAAVPSGGRGRGRGSAGGGGRGKGKAKQGLCDHCGETSSPQWRRGPAAKPMLCNACGVRYKHDGEAGLERKPRGALKVTPHAKASAAAPMAAAYATEDAAAVWQLPPQPQPVRRVPTRPAAAAAVAAAAAAAGARSPTRAEELAFLREAFGAGEALPGAGGDVTMGDAPDSDADHATPAAGRYASFSAPPRAAAASPAPAVPPAVAAAVARAAGFVPLPVQSSDGSLLSPLAAARARAAACYGDGPCSCAHCAAPKLRKRCLRHLAAEGSLGSEVALAGARAIGLEVEVLWPRDAAWYRAVVQSYDGRSRSHALRYLVDGETETRRLWTDLLRFPPPGEPRPARDVAEEPLGGGPPPQGWMNVREAMRREGQAAPKPKAQTVQPAKPAAPVRGGFLAMMADDADVRPTVLPPFVDYPPGTLMPFAAFGAPYAGTGRAPGNKPPYVTSKTPKSAEILGAGDAPVDVSALEALRADLAALPGVPPAYWRLLKRFARRGCGRDDLDRGVAALGLSMPAQHAHHAFITLAAATPAHKAALAAMFNDEPAAAPVQSAEERAAAEAAEAEAERLAAEAFADAAFA